MTDVLAPEVDLKKVQSEGIFVDITESANERPDCAYHYTTLVLFLSVS